MNEFTFWKWFMVERTGQFRLFIISLIVAIVALGLTLG